MLPMATIQMRRLSSEPKIAASSWRRSSRCRSDPARRDFGGVGQDQLLLDLQHLAALRGEELIEVGPQHGVHDGEAGEIEHDKGAEARDGDPQHGIHTMVGRTRMKGVQRAARRGDGLGSSNDESDQRGKRDRDEVNGNNIASSALGRRPLRAALRRRGPSRVDRVSSGMGRRSGAGPLRLGSRLDQRPSPVSGVWLITRSALSACASAGSGIRPFSTR